MRASAAESVKHTRAAYDRLGAAYDAETEDFNRTVAYPHLIELVERQLPGGLKADILDVGCGSGRLLEMLAHRGARVKGLELSDKQTEEAKARGLDVMRGSMLALPYPDRHFDVVVSYHSFNYLPHSEHPLVLHEQWRMLRHGGSMVLAVFYTKHNESRPVVIEKHGVLLSLYLRTLEELKEMVHKVGFTFICSSFPLCTEQELLIAGESLRPVIESQEGRYALFVVAKKY